VMRQNGTARGDEGKAHHCGQLPSHGIPPFLSLHSARAAAAAPCASMQCECCHWDRKKTPAIKDATPADGLSRCLSDERRYRHIPFSRQLSVGRAVRRYLYQERGVSERSSWLVDVPIFVHAAATGHLIEVGGLHIRDFYYPGALCLRSVARHFAAPRQSAAAIDQT
jgi:hypothetical protein